MSKLRIFIENVARILKKRDGVNINLKNNDVIMYLKTEYLDYSNQRINDPYYITTEQEKKYIKRFK